ncbi:DUF413 domain-containing protein [Neiella marina]|uniref:Macrodomain Ori protein n=1 Tax=Neiella holothuriorum TaxID=2870530 RepID=A0ABS7EBE2_9GAMM|nr:DUF413 domain-containing protein [Neiella holothuriorum]MBW8189647.1 DUF413 domain-containing protein [Neiella holothuriorum]
MNTQIRLGTTRFYDSQKFARGFQKSGDFTVKESDLLTVYGATLSQLERGELQPESDAESQFLAVLRGEQAAQTELEKVWLKYVGLARNKRRFHAVTSYRRNHDGDTRQLAEQT